MLIFFLFFYTFLFEKEYKNRSLTSRGSTSMKSEKTKWYFVALHTVFFANLAIIFLSI
jgi:hypothetical protein